MSVHPESGHADPDAHHGGGHGDDHGDDHDHGTYRTYLTGFILSVILTAIPFAVVMTGALPTSVAVAIVVGFAVVQIVVQMIYFLHMSPRSEGGWNLLALMFTLIIVVIVLSGSLWVMHHLNTNMMPVHDMEALR